MYFTYLGYLQKGNSLTSIYECLSKDFIYPDPQNLVTFLDNHDVERATRYSASLEKYKIALALLLTTRGIPQLYYGTEIGLKGGKDHGRIREDFPGGFPGNNRSAFTESGRTSEENELFNFTKGLINLRKRYPSLSEGKLLHYPPADEVYLYLKIRGEEKILAVVNGNQTDMNVSTEQVKHHLVNTESIKNLLTNEVIPVSEGLTIPSKAMSVTFYKIEEKK
jgi:glycosidase